MRNAHERFGTVQFTKQQKDTTTRFRVYTERVVMEPGKGDREPAALHCLSLLGSDAEIAAMWSAVIEGALFEVRLPDGSVTQASLGKDAECFRGSILVPSRKRPVRHLVALSREMIKTRPGADRDGNRTVLSSDDPAFVLHRVSRRFGLPAVPDWAEWFLRELKLKKAIHRLVGLGCSPVLVKGTKGAFLDWIGKGIRKGAIRFPEENGPVSWDRTPRCRESELGASDGNLCRAARASGARCLRRG
jgi:hypothetical protein